MGPLIGFRGDGSAEGRGEPNPEQMQRYIENGAFYQAHVPEGAEYYKPWNAAYQDWAVATSFFDAPQPYLFTLWSEPMRRFQLAAEGRGTGGARDGLVPVDYAGADTGPEAVVILRAPSDQRC